jgi:flagellar motor switch protein FliG
VNVLSGPEKAVLFLLSLDEDVARPIVNELSEGDLRKLRTVAATMREVPAGALDEAFRDFVARSANAVAVPRGGLPYLRRLSASALGEERTRAVFEDGVTSPLARLESAPADAVSALLANEPPQLAAAVLARMEPGAAASVLMAMPEDRQAAVVAHVGRLTELPARIIEEIATALTRELPTEDASTLITVDGVARAAEILNAVGRDCSTRILGSIGDMDTPLASDVRMAMFTFDDLARVDAKAMRDILREVPGERVTLALKGANPAVAKAIFAGLSSRAAEMIRDDLELLGQARKSDVDAARKEVVEVALRLETEGRVNLGREGD